ncbi:MAG: LysR family transcriptional regulator [Clostridia bacterium]|nr:LysR family transcriptional regulator [Clostridia bacterium]
MTFEQLKVVLEIAKTGSINQAAQNLFLTQPALSKSLRALERELGQDIFYRSHSGAVLTPYGELFVKSAENVIKNLSIIRDMAHEEESWYYHSLSVATGPTRFSGAAFSRVVSRHYQSAVKLSHICSSASESYANVLNRSADIGVVTITTLIKNECMIDFANNEIEYVPLRQFDPCITVGEDSPLFSYAGDTLPLSELRDLSLFSVFEHNSLFQRMNKQEAEALGARYSVDFRDSRAAISDSIRRDEFRCNLASQDIYKKLGTANSIFTKGRTFMLEGPSPFHFEVGWLHNRNLVLTPLAEEYIAELSAIANA